MSEPTPASQPVREPAGPGLTDPGSTDHEATVVAITGWYRATARDLPWRAPGVTPWAVLVSEVMLQQTPVRRVLPVFEQWLTTWPTPRDLAAAPSGAAVRAWGRLGYPRRALRLHATAVRITADYGGEVPRDITALRSLPGVGDYTAAAIASFAFGDRVVVLDTNIRRVLARAYNGVEHPPRSIAKAERDLGETLLPAEDPALWSVSVMELGALVCTAAAPRCDICPLRERCAWLAAGQPAYDGPSRPVQQWVGTDRMVRGRLMAVLREGGDSVARRQLDAVWHDEAQRERALASLLDDGLVVQRGERYALPD